VNKPRSKLLVIGLGNRLAGDDAAGSEVIDRLRTHHLPDKMRVEEAPGGALSLASLWQREDHVWLIDAVLSGKEAGAITVLDKKALLASPRGHDSAHLLSLSESLLWLNHTYPEMTRIHYRLWGIEAQDTSMGKGLSPAVAAAVKRTTSQVSTEAFLLLGKKH
jgi:hydrogenase maturation protease